MTMGILWTGMVAAALVCGAVNGRLTAVTAAALEGAGAAVELTLAMAGVLCLWSGVLEVMARSGMADGLSRLLRPVLPFLLAFAAGAMVYVVLEELNPQAQTGPHGHTGTMGAAAGFALMMAMDVALG